MKATLTSYFELHISTDALQYSSAQSALIRVLVTPHHCRKHIASMRPRDDCTDVWIINGAVQRDAGVEESILDGWCIDDTWVWSEGWREGEVSKSTSSTQDTTRS